MSAHVFIVVGDRDVHVANLEGVASAHDAIQADGSIDHRLLGKALVDLEEAKLRALVRSGKVSFPIVARPLCDLASQHGELRVCLVTTDQVNGLPWQRSTDTVHYGEAMRRALPGVVAEIAGARVTVEPPIVVTDDPSKLVPVFAAMAGPIAGRLSAADEIPVVYLQAGGTAPLRLAVRLALLGAGDVDGSQLTVLGVYPDGQVRPVQNDVVAGVVHARAIFHVARWLAATRRPAALSDLARAATPATAQSQYAAELAHVAAILEARTHNTRQSLFDHLDGIKVSLETDGKLGRDLLRLRESRNDKNWRDLARRILAAEAVAARERVGTDDVAEASVELERALFLLVALDDDVTRTQCDATRTQGTRDARQAMDGTRAQEGFRALRHRSFLAHQPRPLPLHTWRAVENQATELLGATGPELWRKLIIGLGVSCDPEDDLVGRALARAADLLNSSDKSRPGANAGSSTGSPRTIAIAPLGPMLVPGGNDLARGVVGWCADRTSVSAEDLENSVLSDLLLWHYVEGERPVDDLILVGTDQTPHVDPRDTACLADLLASSVPNWETEVASARSVIMPGNPADEEAMGQAIRRYLAPSLPALCPEDRLVVLEVGGTPALRQAVTLWACATAWRAGADVVLAAVGRTATGTTGQPRERAVAATLEREREHAVRRAGIRSAVRRRDPAALAQLLDAAGSSEEVELQALAQAARATAALQRLDITAAAKPELRAVTDRVKTVAAGGEELRKRLTLLWHECRALIEDDPAAATLRLVVLADGVAALRLGALSRKRSFADALCELRTSPPSDDDLATWARTCKRADFNARPPREEALKSGEINASAAAGIIACAADPCEGCPLAARWRRGFPEEARRLLAFRRGLAQKRTGIAHTALISERSVLRRALAAAGRIGEDRRVDATPAEIAEALRRNFAACKFEPVTEEDIVGTALQDIGKRAIALLCAD